MFVLSAQQDPSHYAIPFNETTLEALLLRFPHTSVELCIALLEAQANLGNSFRLPARNGLNMPSVMIPGMFYVTETWAAQCALTESAVNVTTTEHIVGANYTTSSSQSTESEDFELEL